MTINVRYKPIKYITYIHNQESDARTVAYEI